MKILAIDPGTSESGWCMLEDGLIVDNGICDNVEMLARLDLAALAPDVPTLAIEMVASYGMPVGAETFRTVWWTGRFAERWHGHTGRLCCEVFRKDVKLHLCGSPRAKDANIRQSLIDRIGAPGTKKAPGGTYGVRSHAWAALAVAVTMHDKLAVEKVRPV